MITLEQIRLLEAKITRAIELIRVLKEENTTLRKGLESTQKRMKELEGLVDGFKADQKEIESVIVRTLHNLDELEESTTARHPERAPAQAERAATVAAPAPSPQHVEQPAGPAVPAGQAALGEHPSPGRPNEPQQPEAHPPKEELDIF